MAHKKYSKTEINKLLVAERKKSRIKQQHSLFMSRTLGIYRGQVNRFVEETRKSKAKFPYTLEQFRAHCQDALSRDCYYCDKKLTPKSMCGDHRLPLVRGGSFKLTNMRIIHANCNWRKGLMTESEFQALQTFVDTRLAPIAAADLWKRLGIGGKWAPR